MRQTCNCEPQESTQKPLYLQSDIREFHLQVLANANRLEIRR